MFIGCWFLNEMYQIKACNRSAGFIRSLEAEAVVQSSQQEQGANQPTAFLV